MVTRLWPFFLSLALTLPVTAAGAEPSGALIGPGDRVVFLGNTFIERDQSYGYLETALTLRHPGRPIVFRNLGWSGDTVFGVARASFDPPPVGFQRLKEHVLAEKPTVLLVGYGAVESFDGADGLPKFRDGLKTLLDTLAESKARIILLSPLRQEDLGRPLPDPARHNEDLRLYRDELRQVARERGLAFVDLFDLPADSPHPLTDDGLHPTAFGYWYLALGIERALRAEPARVYAPDPLNWYLKFDADQANRVEARVTNGMTLSKVIVEPDRVAFQILDDILPFPSPPAGPARKHDAEPDRSLKIEQLPPGRYVLKIDGKEISSGHSAPDFARGLRLERGPEFDQVEALRAAIVRKNQLYFYRWRPQNETYLFGFRKHEQGRNGAEIVQFDPLIAEQESAIARLSVPVAHTYELTRDVAKEGR